MKKTLDGIAGCGGRATDEFLPDIIVHHREGEGHVVDRKGRPPDSPERWGWRKSGRRGWVPQGTRIGWLTGRDLFLDPVASYEAAQKSAGTERFQLSAQSLLKGL